MVVAVPSAGPSKNHTNCHNLRHLKRGVKFYIVAAMKVRRKHFVLSLPSRRSLELPKAAPRTERGLFGGKPSDWTFCGRRGEASFVYSTV